MDFKMVSAGFIILVLLLTGCGSETSSFAEYASIQKIDNAKETVRYGMSREDAEKVLGTGKEVQFGHNYSHGVKVHYREDKVVGIMFDQEAAEVYETTKGVKIGMSKSEIKEIYRDQPFSDGPYNLGYLYDPETKSFLGKDSLFNKTEEEMKQFIMVDFQFDKDDLAYRISLMDQHMLQLGR